MHKNDRKGKHNNPKPMGFSKAVLKGRFIAIQAYLKKQEKNQINNLTLQKNQINNLTLQKNQINNLTRKRRNEEPQS